MTLASPLRRLARLRDDTSGLALLEFAFSLPIVLVMSLTGAEVTNYIVTKMRISQISLHLADNSARIGAGSQLQAKTISETDINDLLTGAQLQSGDLDLYKNGRVILSSIEPVANPNTNNKYKITWQRCKGEKVHESTFGDQGDTNIDGIGPDNRKAIAVDSGAAMFVEVYYEYKPLIKSSLAPSKDMIEIASMMVRDRRDLSKIYNNEKAPVANC